MVYFDNSLKIGFFLEKNICKKTDIDFSYFVHELSYTIASTYH